MSFHGQRMAIQVEGQVGLARREVGVHLDLALELDRAAILGVFPRICQRSLVRNLGGSQLCGRLGGRSSRSR